MSFLSRKSGIALIASLVCFSQSSELYGNCATCSNPGCGCDNPTVIGTSGCAQCSTSSSSSTTCWTGSTCTTTGVSSCTNQCNFNDAYYGLYNRGGSYQTEDHTLTINAIVNLGGYSYAESNAQTIDVTTGYALTLSGTGSLNGGSSTSWPTPTMAFDGGGTLNFDSSLVFYNCVISLGDVLITNMNYDQSAGTNNRWYYNTGDVNFTGSMSTSSLDYIYLNNSGNNTPIAVGTNTVTLASPIYDYNYPTIVGGLNLSGNGGKIILSNVNSYTVGTVINSGLTVQITNAWALGNANGTAGNVLIAGVLQIGADNITLSAGSGSQFQIANFAEIDLNGNAFTLNMPLAKQTGSVTPYNIYIVDDSGSNDGVMNFSGDSTSWLSSTDSGTITVWSGALQISNALTSAFQVGTYATITVNAPGILQLVGDGANPMTNEIRGFGTLVIAGGSGSTSTLSFANGGFGGEVILTSGTLSIPAATNLGSGRIVGNGGTLATTNTMSINNPWSLTGGTTTTFTVATGDSLTLTGAITTTGSGTALIVTTPSVGSLVLTPGSIALTSNLQTNGNSISTGTISGSGGLILGVQNSLTPDVLTITGASNYSGNISSPGTGSSSGVGAVVITAGSGNTVTFSGNNTFTGGVTLNSGTLSIASQNDLSSSTITGNGGTLLSTNSTLSLNNSLILSAGTTYFAVTSITAPTISGSGNLSLEGSGGGLGTLTIAGTSAYSGIISNNTTTVSGGTAAVEIQAGSGNTVTFTGASANTFTGGLTLTSGTLSITAANQMSTGTITGNGGTLSGPNSIGITNPWILNGGGVGVTTTTFNVATSQTVSLEGTVTTAGSGTAQITKTGSGTLVLIPSTLTIISGTSLQTNGNSLSTPSISGSGGLILGVQSSLTPDVLTITGASTYSGAISSPGTGSSTGVGAVVITVGGGNTVTFSGNNTFTGGVTLNSGTLSITSQSNLSSSNIITGNGGTLISAGALSNSLVLSSSTTNFAVSSLTAPSISGSGNLSLEGSGGGLGTLTIAGTSAYSGIISNNTTTVSGGTAAVVIAAGTNSGVNKIVALSGTNTFSGGLTLTSGTLEVGVVTNLGSSSATILGNGSGTGATLRNASSPPVLITITNPWTFNAGNTTSFGGALTLTGAFSVPSGTGTATITKLSGATLTLSPSSLNISEGATFATNGNNITVTGNNGLATGSGTLALGKAGNPTTTDTLTIGAATNFSGMITNNGSGLGAVVIASGSGNVVTLTPILSSGNSFTGGLTLTSGTLSIATSGGIGGTTTNPNRITFNGGTLSNSTITSIGLVNTVTFNGGTSSAVAGGSFVLSGPFTVTAGTAAVVNSSTSLSLTPSSLTMAAGSTLAISGANSTFSITTGPLVVTGTSGTSTITNSGGSITLAPTSLTIATGTTFATNDNNISVPSFNAGSGTLDLGTGTLTIPSGGSPTDFSGIIMGSGGILVLGPIGLYGVNTFSGDITLSSATTGNSSLTISAASGLGSSGNVITGNGGTLITSASSTIPLSNNWIFNAGALAGNAITTTLNVGSTSTLTLTGPMATSTGLGTAVITAQGAGLLTLTPSTLTINSTALQIVGNTAANSSISTGVISGSGGLILGGTSSSAIGTLTLTGTSTYAGVISDNPTASSGKGAVVIASSGTVAFTGLNANTFSGGLTLTSGTLLITVANQVGTGTIIGNEGILSTSGSSITLSNPISLNVGTSTTFNSQTSGTILTLNGPLAVTAGTTGTATMATGSGLGTVVYSPSTLTIPVNTTLATNGNSVQTGGFGSGTGTLALGSNSVLDTLTVAASSSTTFAGNIVNGGTSGGAVVINSPSVTVNFTGATASTFSQGLNLTAGTLTITAANQVGTGAITGNGGSLTTSTAILTLANNLVLTSGTTTTFIVPNITVSGGGSGISGSGGLALGGILTIQDGSTYPGIISDAATTNIGSVVIDAGVNTVTFAGVSPSTFTGGLTLTSGTLEISSSVNLGSSTGVITGNGGILQTDVISSGSTITNNWSFINGKTTTFNIEGDALTLTGVFSVATGTSTIVKTGAGTLNLNPTSLNIVTNSTLQITNTNLNIGSASFAGNFGSCAGNQGTCAGTLSLTNSALIVASNAKTLITFGGNVVGTGSVVIEANVSFFGQNTFSGGLMLNPSLVSGVSSLLTITPSLGAPNQIGTGTITGSGGGLATTASFTVSNALQLTGGTTTTFTTTQNAATLSFTGDLSTYTVSSGTATISTSGSNGPVVFGTTSAPLSSVTIISGTTLATNGSSLVTNSLAGVSGGVLMLGGSRSTDTLTIQGTGSTYPGNIVDNTAITGIGAVVIKLASSLDTVTFSGNNTFSGGLTLSLGTLIISEVDSGTSNIGSLTGTVTFNGGELENSNSGLGSLITLTNPIVFYGGTTPTFTNYFSLQGSITTVAQGSGVVTISGAAGNTTLLNPSSLSILNSTTLATNGNSITVGSGGFVCAAGSSCNGVLSLGKVSGSVVDTLTIANTSNTSFGGNITQVASGLGAVVIAASTGKSVTLSGTGSNFSGGLALNSGTLIISSASNIGGSAGAITGNGGTLTNFATNANLSLTNPLSLNSGTTSLLLINITTSGVSNNLGSGNLILGGFNSSTPGTLTINGASSYSGVISNSSNNSTGQVVIAAGTGNTVAFSGGASTFSGGLSLNSGILSITSSGNVGASTGTITGNGGTLSTITNTISLSNPWSLTGGATTTFTVATGQSLTLTGAIATTGSGTAQIVTTPSVGSLVLTPSSLALTSSLQTNGNSLSTPSISGSGGLILGASGPITDTLTITGASTYSGIISNNSGGGLGAVVINSSNKTVTFSGASTFSGGLTLTAGSLQITAANNLGSASTSITGNGGTLVVGTDAAATFTVSNPWELASSTTTTFEINDYQPSGVGATPVATTVTLSGVISGDGALTMNGSGTLILTAASTYTGTTTVSDGMLTINGSVSPTTGSFTATVDGGGTLTVGSTSSFTSAVMYSSLNPGTINNSGVLTGYGTINGTVTNNHGSSQGNNLTIVKGGNSIGNLTIDGDLDFGTGTFFVVEISPTEASKVVVTGLTTIASGAEVTVITERGTYDQPMTYTIAQADGGFTGQFDVIKLIPGVYFKAILFLDGPTLLNTTITPQSLGGDGLAQGSNAISVATALDEVIAQNRATVEWRLTPQGPVAIVPPELPSVLESLFGFTTAEEMTYALNQLHPAPFKGMTIVQQNNAVEVREALSNRMQNEMDSEYCFVLRSDEEEKSHSCKKEKRSLQVWANGIGDVVDQDSNSYKSNPEIGYQSHMAGVVLGIDKRFAEHYYVGALGGYTSSHMNWKQNIGTGDVNSGYAGIYASAIGKMFYGNASATVGWNEFSASRNIIYPGVNLTAKNDHLGTQLLSHLDTGVNIGFKGMTLRPFDSFDYVAQRENSYTETNAGEWNLHVKKTNAILIRNELGLQFSSCFCLKSSKWTVAPKLSWVREVRVKGGSFVAEFAGTDSTFEVVGYYPDRSLISPGVVVSGLMLNDRLTLGAYYNGEFRGGYSAHNYGGELRFGF